VESLSATALLVRRAAFESVGGFDERFFLYAEDMDLSRRLRLGGWQLYAAPSIWARHRWGSSSHDTVRREILWWQGAMTYAARWYSRTGWLAAFAACTFRALTLSGSHPRQARGILNALIVEMRLKKSLMRTDLGDDHSNDAL
jgi:N-acetylglucosaminyl-diphospho-decaprenol L-rhamnosyltransferase